MNPTQPNASNTTPSVKTPAQVIQNNLNAPSPSERFTAAVFKEYSSHAGEATLTNMQTKLIQNYFVKIDQVLKSAEIKRLAKSENYRDKLPVTWENVNMNKLAVDVMAWSSVGLDPTLPNQLSPIPFKNTSLNKYDINLMEGYVGLNIMANKFGFDSPDNIVIELIYSNDLFKQFKKDRNNSVESYEFTVENPFDRGDVVGGFYYLEYIKNPNKNKLRVFPLDEITKRIPDYASVEFWGGEKDEWVNGQRTGNKIKIEGWRNEMLYKTVARAAFKSIPLDSMKISSNMLDVMIREEEYFGRNDSTVSNAQNDINQNANKPEPDFTDHQVISDPNFLPSSAGESFLNGLNDGDGQSQELKDNSTSGPTSGALQMNAFDAEAGNSLGIPSKANF